MTNDHQALHRLDQSVFDVRLDRDSSIPAFKQLKYYVINAISTTRIRPGDVMPSVRDLSKWLDLAPATIQRAYGELKNEGFLASKARNHTYVADLAHHIGPKPTERALSLRDILAPAVTSARSLGFTEQEIFNALTDLSLPVDERVSRPRVVFIASGMPAVNKYVDILTRALSSVNAEVSGFDMETAPDRVSRETASLMQADLLVCPVSELHQVTELGNELGVASFGLMVEPSESTMRILAELPLGSRIGVVSETRFSVGIQALIRTLRGPDVVVVAVTEDDEPDTSALAECDVIFRTFRTEELAERVVPEDVDVYQLDFLPSPASIEYLKEQLLKMSDSGVRNLEQVIRASEDS